MSHVGWISGYAKGGFDIFKWFLSIISFPCASIDMPSIPSCAVYILQLIRYARRCSLYNDFGYCHKLWVDGLPPQGCEVKYCQFSMCFMSCSWLDMHDTSHFSMTLDTVINFWLMVCCLRAMNLNIISFPCVLIDMPSMWSLCLAAD